MYFGNVDVNLHRGHEVICMKRLETMIMMAEVEQQLDKLRKCRVWKCVALPCLIFIRTFLHLVFRIFL